VRVASGNEVLIGFVQQAKQEESASKQLSFSRRREVKTPAIKEASPSCEMIGVQA